MITDSEKARFFTKVFQKEGCWLWLGSCFIQSGYTRFTVGKHRDGTKRSALGHRVSWEIFNGEITDGMDVLHSCDNVECVNPDHLFLGTDQDNVDDKMSKGRGPVGFNNGRAKAKIEDIRFARMSFLGDREVASLLNLSKTTVTDMRSGKLWLSA